MSVFYSEYSDIILTTLSILLLGGATTCFFISRERNIPQTPFFWRCMGVALLLLGVREVLAIASLSITSFVTGYPFASICQAVAGLFVLAAVHKSTFWRTGPAILIHGGLAIFLLVLVVLAAHPLVFPREYALFGGPGMSSGLFLLIKISLCPVALLLAYRGFASIPPLPWNVRMFLIAFLLHAVVVALCRPPDLPSPPYRFYTPSAAITALFVLRITLAFAMTALVWDIYSRSLGAVVNLRWWPLLFKFCIIAGSLLFVVVSSSNYSQIVRKNLEAGAKNGAAAIPPEALVEAGRTPGAANSPDISRALFGATRKLELFQGYSTFSGRIHALAAPAKGGKPKPIVDLAHANDSARWASLPLPLNELWERARDEGIYVHEGGVAAAEPFVYIAPVFAADGDAVGAAVLAICPVELTRDQYGYKRPLLLLLPAVFFLGILLVSGQQRSWLAAHSSQRADALRMGTLSSDLNGIVVIAGTGANAVFVDINTRFAEMLGVDPDALIGKAVVTAFRFASPEGIDRVKAMCAEPIEKCIANLELPVLREDGRLVHMLVHGRPLTDEPGEKLYVWQCVDITQIRGMEREVVETRDMLQLILDTIPEAVFVKDGFGRYIHSNQAFHRFLHLKEGETAIGKRLGEMHPRESVLTDANDQICRDMLGKTHTYTQGFNFDGEESFWEISKTLSHMGDRDESQVIVGCIHDLTPRKKIEDAINGERHFLRQLIDSLPVSVCFVDTNRNIKVCDRQFCHAAGFRNPEDLVGRRFEDVSPFGPSDKLEDESLLASGEGHRDASIEIIDGDRVRNFIVRSSVMCSCDGQVLGLVKSFWDTTQLVAATHAARKAERAKAAFLANMSHELRTPMNGIVGMADLIIDHRATEPLQRLHAETILRSAKTLQMVIDEVLDVAAIDDSGARFALHAAPFPLLALVEEAVQVVTCIVEAWGVELSLHYDFSLETVYEADARHLRQILVQVLTHCSRLTGDKRLRLQVEKRDEGRAAFQVGFMPSAGVTARELESMLKNPDGGRDDPGNATNLGIFNDRIGLPLAWRLINGMSGELQVSDELDGTICCEAIVPLASHAGEEPSLFAPDFSNTRMLVASGIPERTRAIVGSLEFAQGAVTQVDTVDSLRSALSKAADAGRPFRLVVFDSSLASPTALAGVVAEMNNHFDGVPGGPNIILVVSSTQVQNFSLPPNAVKFLQLPPICPSELWYKAEVCLHGFTREPMRFRRRTTRITRLMKIPANVLLVEDNSVNQMVAMAILKRIGCETTLAKDGGEAVDLVVNQDMRFDLILMDCMMPVMDGYEATTRIRMHERLRGTDRNIIIALTANSLAGDREKCLAAGMDDYMTKPVTLERVRDCLLKYCPILATMIDQSGDDAVGVG